jgi:ATP-dependent Clp protease ATP-binding subunit ClpA
MRMVGFLLADERDPNKTDNPQDQSKTERALARLTPSCRAVLEHANQEASARGAAHLACEDLLIGLADHEETAAGRLLASISITAADIRARLGFVQGYGATVPPHGEPLPLSPRLERVLLAAAKDCDKRSLAKIGALHLLAALVSEREGVAVFILEEPGVGLERLGAALQKAYREKWDDD